MVVGLGGRIGLLAVCLVACVVHCTSAKKSISNGHLINKALEATFLAFEGSTVGPSYSPVTQEYSSVLSVCHNLDGSEDSKRIGCCTPNDVRHMYNVLIENKKLVLFVPSKKDAEAKNLQLPPVQSVRSREKVNNALTIEYREGPFDPTKHCTHFFNGTLHFTGRSTVQNVYHALGDNVLPLMGQMLMDYYLAGDMLYLPRMILTNYQSPEGRDPLRQVSQKRGNANQNQVQVNARGSMEEGSVALHMRLMEDIMSDGALSLSQASGMCFRRLIWGHGPHMFYTAMMQRLRRLTARFAREFMLQFVQQHSITHPMWHRWNEESDSAVQQQMQKVIQTASATANVAAALTNSSFLVNAHGEPLKALVYTRGNSGKGRTIQNEDMIVRALQSRGAQVFICCNFANTSLEQQLYYALHADIIVGMHGAALTHGVFMRPGTITLELKTLYAYESILFPLVSDAHLGIHAQVNIKKYFVPGGQKPIDAPLITRILRVLDHARAMQRKLGYDAVADSLVPMNNEATLTNEDNTLSNSIDTVNNLPTINANIAKGKYQSVILPTVGSMTSTSVTNDTKSKLIRTAFGQNVLATPPVNASPYMATASSRHAKHSHNQFKQRPRGQTPKSPPAPQPGLRALAGKRPVHKPRPKLGPSLPATSVVKSWLSALVTPAQSASTTASTAVAIPARVPSQPLLEQSQVCSKEGLVDFVGGSTLNRSPTDGYNPAAVGALGHAVRGDVVFGIACSDQVGSSASSGNRKQKILEGTPQQQMDNGLRHVLGPMQDVHTASCQQSVYQFWREVLENKEEGIHCRMCDPYVL